VNQSVSTKDTVPFSHLPDEGFIRQKELLQLGLIPWSAASLWRKCRSNSFPQPIKISPGITAWRIRDVREWLDDPAGYRSTSTE
jgi:prophage regulatory protein